MNDSIKQLLFNEIQRLHIEEKEKKENIQNFRLISIKYQFLSDVFDQYSVTADEWEKLNRDAFFFTENDVKYMYERIMQIARRFREQTGKFFEFKSSSGTHLIPDRLSDLIRLFELYEEFFYNIYPAVANQLNIHALTVERDKKSLSGKVVWNKTILNNISKSASNVPLSIVSLVSESSLETPENLLLLSYVLRMRIDCNILRVYLFQDPLNSEERLLLAKISDGCNAIIRNTILQDLVHKGLEYANLPIYETQLLNLEFKVLSRLNDGLIRQKAYRNLLEWIRKYRELNIRIISPNHTSYPIDKVDNLDIMFEWWILFELLDYLITYLDATIIKSPRLDRFHVKVKGFEFDLYYQRTLEGWARKGEPDYTIEVEGKVKVIMDAKNWQDQKESPIYKMLGYLNNFDNCLGVLFFPNFRSLDNDRSILLGQNLRNHLNQCLINSVIPLSAQNRVELKKSAFNTLINQIIKYIQ